MWGSPHASSKRDRHKRGSGTVFYYDMIAVVSAVHRALFFIHVSMLLAPILRALVGSDSKRFHGTHRLLNLSNHFLFISVAVNSVINDKRYEAKHRVAFFVSSSPNFILTLNSGMKGK
jgi:hypothetical protein